MSQIFQATTAGITVAVRAVYLPGQSNPKTGHFVWAYHITITNESDIPVQLLRRTWYITDEHGYTQRVHGDGVVGEQPLLEPGESFAYSSGTSLATPSGFMTGQYHMEAATDGRAFDIAIPAFSLDSPEQNATRH
ncbi:MAG TPA: Co2+/Mg2+ efflux protein ApaG [Acidocella sp.]|nr:MAG: Co2+/Mg2+ efflux protein ApaG [Acidocella sp. 20-61-6]HQT45699.1 Co2+/Mg2+ efflux protein ApaG [Acidocella sp.]